MGTVNTPITVMEVHVKASQYLASVERQIDAVCKEVESMALETEGDSAARYLLASSDFPARTYRTLQEVGMRLRSLIGGVELDASLAPRVAPGAAPAAVMGALRRTCEATGKQWVTIRMILAREDDGVRVSDGRRLASPTSVAWVLTRLRKEGKVESQERSSGGKAKLSLEWRLVDE